MPRPKPNDFICKRCVGKIDCHAHPFVVTYNTKAWVCWVCGDYMNTIEIKYVQPNLTSGENNEL